MADFRFALIVSSRLMAEEAILDATDALGDAGCTDASIRGDGEGMELLFARSARSLQTAIASAVADVENAGFRVVRVGMDREFITM